MRKRSVIATGAAVIAIPAAIVPAIVYTAGTRQAETKKTTVSVPNLIGLRGAAADAKLRRLGLKLFADQSGMNTPSDTSSNGSITLTLEVTWPTPGFVVGQSPGASPTVPRGSTISIVVAPRP